MVETGPAAAYLYVLSLDGPARAWEYLRRNDRYRDAWQQRGSRGTPAALRRSRRSAEPWGLRCP